MCVVCSIRVVLFRGMCFVFCVLYVVIVVHCPMCFVCWFVVYCGSFCFFVTCVVVMSVMCSALRAVIADCCDVA